MTRYLALVLCALGCGAPADFALAESYRPADATPEAEADASRDVTVTNDASGDVGVDAAPDMTVSDVTRWDAAPDAPAADGRADAFQDAAADIFEDARTDTSNIGDVTARDAGTDAPGASDASDGRGDAGADGAPDAHESPAVRCRRQTACDVCLASPREPDGSGCGWCGAAARCIWADSFGARGFDGCGEGGYLPVGSTCR